MVEDFGPYRIARKIAVGGMAEIYLARQRSLEGVERTVVLKRILPTYIDNPEFVTMFLDEARLLAALSHPNIAQVFDLGKIEDSYYLVMEYVRGPTLGALLQAAIRSGRPGLPEQASLSIALNVAEALSYVHARRDELGRPLNIVHRDLNPANVIVSYDGAVKLIDFGIAKAATKVYETRTGVIKGTYGYIAPEQLTRTAPVDHRADVFALGVLLYEMCVGQHPFDTSDEPNLIDRILTASYKRPRQVVPSFPKVLDRLIASCLTPHPEGRPDNVRTLISGLTQYMGERSMVPTMGEVGRVAHSLVPDTEGPAPLRPLTGPKSRRPFGNDPSRTMKLPQAVEDEATVMDAPNLADLLEGQELTIRVANPEPHELAALEDADDAAETVVAPITAGERERLRVSDGRRRRPQVSDPPTNELAALALEDDAGTPGVQAAEARRRTSDRPEGGGMVRKIALFAASGLLVGGVGALAFVTARAIGEQDGQATTVEGPPASTEAAAQGPDAAVPDEALAFVEVLSEPPGATVSMDGVEIGQVTPATISLPPGTGNIWIRVSMPGYITQERQVQATVGEARFVLTALETAGADAGATAEGAEEAETTPPRPVPTRRRRGR